MAMRDAKGNLLRGSLILAAVAVALVMGRGVGLAAESRGCVEKEVKTVVHAAAQGLAALLKDQPDKAAGVALLRAFIAPIRFLPDGSGYLYVYDLNGVNIAHAAQPDLQGKNLIDITDPKGNHPVRQTVDAALKGGAYFEFFWPQPGKEGLHRKIGYAEPIAGTNYLVGSGFYPED